MPTRSLRSQCAIVGAGLAGAATAFQLTRRGFPDIVILEQETTPGCHSSGRNAAMVRQVVLDEDIAPLAREGARFIAEVGRRWGRPELFRQAGSLLLVRDRGRLRGSRSLETARQQTRRAEWWDPPLVEERVAVLRRGDFEGGIYTPSDGTVDAHALLQGYLRDSQAAGARLLLSQKVTEILVDRSSAIAGLKAGTLEIITPRVVNAAGAWASSIARLAGALDVGLTPYRRHLFHTGAYPRASADWPFVWHLDYDVYFRPESSGLLLSPCDEVATEPGIPDTDPEAVTLLGRKLESAFPALTTVPVARCWAGLRTFAADRRFVIGPDPLVRGFFWAAGLGGHGVTTSAAVGTIVADTILEPAANGRNRFSPSRFLEDTAENLSRN